jgi:predicted fused transcriptional regulator/phosphomethylpyrimidine kinase/predicted transcriptional regulator
MMPPCEMMAKTFLPAIRGLVAYELYSTGYSQLKIASILGLSQSAISQILSKPKDTYVKSLVDMGLSVDEITSLTKLITRDIPHDPVRATLTLYSFWLDSLSRGVFCNYHREMYPQLSTCEICLKKIELQDTERAQVLARLERAVKMIEEARYFVNVMPQVAVNIVESVKDAKTIEDIAGIPGRIVVLRDRPKAVSRPEFGGSRHLARVLLTVKKYSHNVNSVINLKFDEVVKEAVRSLGLRYSETEKNIIVGRDMEELVIESISEEFKKAGSLDVVFDRGGYGLEPNTYVFGEDSMKVVEKALKIAKRYIEIKSIRGSPTI